MAEAVTVRIIASDEIRAWIRLSKSFGADVKRLYKAIGLFQAGNISRHMGKANQQDLENPAKGPLKNRSGQLRKSWWFRVIGDRIVWGSSKSYGPTHAFGGVIKAPSGKALAIPTGPAITARSGASTKRPADFPGLLFRKFGSGPPVLGKFGGTKKHPKWITYFILKKSVTIPKRNPAIITASEMIDIEKLALKFALSGVTR